jgi:hypothetical protein
MFFPNDKWKAYLRSLMKSNADPRISVYSVDFIFFGHNFMILCPLDLMAAHTITPSLRLVVFTVYFGKNLDSPRLRHTPTREPGRNLNIFSSENTTLEKSLSIMALA